MKKEKPLIKLDTHLTHQVRNVIRKVLIAEREKLHLRNPRGIIKDIQKIIEKEIETS